MLRQINEIKMKKRKGLQVDFKRNYHDAQLKLMRKKGFSYKAIMRETGLSSGQIAYRVQKGGLVVRKDYRDGLSPQAIIELGRIRRVLDQMAYLRKEIQETFRRR